MSERQQDIGKKRKLGQRLNEGTLAMGDSERPENQILAGLRMIGGIEERGEGNGVDFKIMKRFTVLLARIRMWTPEQILEAMQEGRNIEKLRSAGE